LVGSLEDHAVVVSHLDATHTGAKIKHHVYGRNSRHDCSVRIHRPTTDLLTGQRETYQVAMPPDSETWSGIDILRQIQGVGVMRLRSHDGQDVVLQGSNLVVKASAPHDPDYQRTIWEYDW
jgi:hypothetical protein